MQLAPVWETVPPPGYGGTETVVYALTEELVRRGHDVRLCASGDSVTTAELFSVVPRSLRLAGLTERAAQYAAVHAARSLADAGDFDIVHYHNGPPLDFAMAMNAILPVPMLTTVHNLPDLDNQFIWQSYEGWYNTISQRQTQIMPVLPRARHAGVVYNAIDVESFPFRTEKSDYVLFIGRFSAEKAPHLAVEAARKAGRRIVLAGKAGVAEEREYFETKLAPLLGLPGVEYVGEADAACKRELFAGAQALLLPILWEEPFGLVMVEAMACGTPVIAFRRGAAPEIVRDGETGFLVDDLGGMVEALDKLEAIDHYRCRALVEERFSPATLADAYLSIYRMILGIEERKLDRVAV
ncbi:MAG TPA: glycosyltransferase family 4 protein [Dehalococcoidia bacterium]|nr:glycosyltransferase family 4 protein [Dehalococcoidia bacterium]